MKIADHADLLNAGGYLLVTLRNGTTGYIFRDDTYYPEEPHWMFHNNDWQVTEPVCEVGQDFINGFLEGATVQELGKSWLVER